MSLRAQQQVWDSRLPTRLKIVALALAYFADDAGQRIYPAVDRIAAMSGKHPRQITRDLTELVALDVLVPTHPRVGGHGRATMYVLSVEVLAAITTCKRPRRRTPNPDMGVGVDMNENPDTGDGVSPPLVAPLPIETPTPTVRYPDIPDQVPRHGCHPIREDPLDPLIRTAAPRPRPFVQHAKEPSKDGNYRVICRIVGELLETGQFDDDVDHGALKEAAKVRCGELHIDYGRNPDVDLFVIDKAIASEWWQYRNRTRPLQPRRPSGRKTTRGA